MAVSTLCVRVRVTLRKPAKWILLPLWALQVLCGRKLWAPGWAWKCTVEDVR